MLSCAYVIGRMEVISLNSIGGEIFISKHIPSQLDIRIVYNKTALPAIHHAGRQSLSLQSCELVVVGQPVLVSANEFISCFSNNAS